MRIIFGPAHDALHVDPAAPGVYEWWYFDALSDDGRFALVVIFFLGTPMSPYYKAVARGKTPDARDWCGVFVSVHERVAHECWRERAYAYNVYRGGSFSPAPQPDVRVGGSRMAGGETMQGWRWQVNVNEPGLWTGRTQAALTFTAPGAGSLNVVAPPGHLADTDASAHNWVCVAPVCRAEGTIALPSGKSIAFRGSGYHDHNFGRLPFDDTDLWYWGRVPLTCDDGQERLAVFYHLQPPAPPARPLSALLLLPVSDAGPPSVTATSVLGTPSQPVRSAYGLRHALEVGFTARDGLGETRIVATLHPERGAFSEGPFYRRLPLTIQASEERNGRALWTGAGEGIGEVFRPAGLCGPVASRALWSRLRRRSSPTGDAA